MIPTTDEHDTLARDEMRRLALERLFTRIGDICPLPALAQKILSLTCREDVSAEDLRQVIQSDPALVAKILRRLNSAYYALSNKVSDIRTAVSLLGFREIRNLTMTIYMSRLHEDRDEYKTYRREDLWAHSVGVASVASLISRVCGCVDPEEAYVAGLLHDLGYILLNQNLKRHFYRVIDTLDDVTDTPTIEDKILSFDHAMLGGFVARRWSFAEATADAIAFHHRPLDYTGTHSELVCVVALANYLTTRLGRTSLGFKNQSTPQDEVYSRIKLDQVALSIICERLEETLKKAEMLARV